MSFGGTASRRSLSRSAKNFIKRRRHRASFALSLLHPLPTPSGVTPVERWNGGSYRTESNLLIRPAAQGDFARRAVRKRCPGYLTGRET